MTGPTHLRVRAYNVGFGDAFLLTFRYRDRSERHVLVDFGSTRLPARGPASMEAVAQKIREHTGGKLHMVVVTHRHADHMSGFAGAAGRVIAGLRPELVVQPWTEDPAIAADADAPALAVATDDGTGADVAATRRLALTLADMEASANGVRVRAGRLRAAARAPRTVADEIEFLGETNIRNRPAVEGLMKLGRRRVYASYGTKIATRSVLPGVKVRVLGPPTLEQAPTIRNLAKRDATEYWHMASTTLAASGATGNLFPGASTVRRIPQAARWLLPQVDRMHAEEMLGIVRTIDEALNNTSLILLFDIRGTKLVFPGDAQIENWRYALFDAPDAATNREDLADAAVYKVGHHGSLNGTPKTMWNGFRRKGPEGREHRLASVISTFGGKHGSPGRGTEVPRRKLIEALGAESDVVTTQTLRSTKAFWRDVDIPFRR